MDATLWQHLAASLTRIVLALLAAVVIGIPVGIAMGLSPTVPRQSREIHPLTEP